MDYDKDTVIEMIAELYESAEDKAEVYVTHYDLTGMQPKTPLEAYGLSSFGNSIIRGIETRLEDEHGLGLFPYDYNGTFRVLTMCMKGARRSLARLEKVHNTMDSLVIMGARYSTHDNVTDTQKKDWAYFNRKMMALTLVYEKFVNPEVERLKRRMLVWAEEESGDDDAA